LHIENIMLATVVICTRNRSKLLAEVAHAALAQEFTLGPWELLIVDNASTDDTPLIAQEIVASAPELARLVVEPEIGLSKARNTGFREALGEVVVFLDDDAFPDPGWLTVLVEALAVSDGPMCVGGAVHPLFVGELPPWFRARFLPYLSAWDLGDEVVDVRYNDYPRGANVAYRREVFDRYGGFSTDLGRRGRSLLSCEETELCLRIERDGRGVRFVPGAVVRHRTEADRISRRWLERRFRAQGASEAIVCWMHGGWPAVRRGLHVLRKNARYATRQWRWVGSEFAACQREAALGFLWRIPRAVMGVRRYRPGPGVMATYWMPFA
jgi:glycosyltransferase involved in cell wall biosynthesis